MDRSSELKQKTIEWSEIEGRKKVLVALIKIGFSVSSAEKIVSGRYKHELRHDKATALIKLLSKKGFVLAGTRAS